MKIKFAKYVGVLCAAAMVFTGMNSMTALAEGPDFHDYYDEWCDDENDMVHPDARAAQHDPDTVGYIDVEVADNNLKVGEQTPAVAYTETPSGGDQQIVWESSDPGVAKVSGNGDQVTITGKGVGSCIISADFYVNGKMVDSDYETITVTGGYTRVPVNGVQISANSAQVKVGSNYQLSARVTPYQADDQRVFWVSTDESIATVSHTGLVTAKAEGQCTIVCKTEDGGFSASCTLYVIQPNIAVTGVYCTPEQVNLAVNQSAYVSAVLRPDGATNQNVNWYSNNTKICTVNSTGLVTALSPGNTTITVSTVDGGFTANCTIHVSGTVATNSATVATVDASNPGKNAQYQANIVSQILNAPQNGTVALTANQPLCYDLNVAQALLNRSDVTLQCDFAYNGHVFRMTLPKGYVMSAHADKTGYIDWLVLYNAKDGPVGQMLK